MNPTRNEDRYYYLGWQPTLFDTGAIVRIFGRKGVSQRVMAPEPYPSLSDAWSTIRRHVRTRLRHGYRVVSLSIAEPTAQMQRQFASGFLLCLVGHYRISLGQVLSRAAALAALSFFINRTTIWIIDQPAI